MSAARAPRTSTGRGAAAPDLRLRPMAERDLPAVLEIERASFSVPWSERTFRSLLEREGAALTVALGGRPEELLGYSVLWRAGDEAELGNLAVRRASRRGGVGAALLCRTVEIAREWRTSAVYLEVRVSNEEARALYASAGFREAGRRPGYYVRPREDAIVMRMRL